MKAKDKLESLTEDSKFIGLYDKEKRDEIERKRREAYAKKIGFQEGVEAGIKDGIERVAKEKREIAKNLISLGLTDEQISEATKLSIKEIQKLKESN